MAHKPFRCVVIGVGGTGGWLATGLSMVLEASAPGSMLMLVDGDNYEPKNADRQVFGEFGNKAEVKASEVMLRCKQTIVVPDNRWVVEEPPQEGDETRVAARELLAEGDVVFATVDNFAARKLIFDAARQFDDIDVFTGGNDDALEGCTYHYQRRDGRDTIDHPSEYMPELENPPDRNTGELSCEERALLDGGTQLVAANMMVASFLLGRLHHTFLIDGAEDNTDPEAEIFVNIGLGMATPYDRRPKGEEEASKTPQKQLERIAP